MRIAYVTETWEPSVDGVVTRLEATLAHLARLGHQALIVAPGTGLVPHRHDGVFELPAVGLPFVSGGKPWGLPLVRRVEAAVGAFSPDLIHVLNPFVLGMAGVRVAHRLGLPLVASFHQDIAAVAEKYRVGFLGPIIWAHVRHLHAGAALNLVTSRVMAAELAAHGIERIGLWPFGVDSRRFNPARRRPEARAGLVGPDTEGVVALYVGRLAPEKDLQRLRTLAGASGVALVVVGDGPLRESLEAELDAPNVFFTGWLAGDELADAYAGADVFVFPSTTETLGLVIHEAMASGLPVVAAKSAPSAETLGDSPGGVLLAPGEWDDLAAVVRAVGSPGEERDRRARAARELALGWDWGVATAQLVELYCSVLDGHLR